MIMSHSTQAHPKKPTITKIAVALGCVGLIVALATTYGTPAIKQSGGGGFSIAHAEMLATAAAREARSAAENEVTAAIALKGLEAGSAGIHLIRPMDDPHWNPDSSVDGSVEYKWWPALTVYPDVEYQRRLPVELDPVANHGSCEVSQSRLVSNQHGNASLVQSQDGSYSIVLTFSQRGLDALVLMLQPQNVDETTGKYSDWFHTVRDSSAPPTPMRAVLVADKLAYRPFSISDLVTMPAPASVVIADNLSHGDASGLVARLQ